MKIASVAVLFAALMAIGGCTTVGKGKGKAPPPAAAPIVTKG
jgi:hypothetical protein